VGVAVVQVGHVGMRVHEPFVSVEVGVTGGDRFIVVAVVFVVVVLMLVE
jgi:hypothetical protein